MLKKLNKEHIKQYTQREVWLKEQWEKFLCTQGVLWPTGKVRRAQLVGLSFFLGEAVDKDSLGQFVHEVAGGRLDTQARHLRPLGWNVIGGGRGEARNNHLPNGQILPRNSYALVSISSVSNEFIQSERMKRMGRLALRDWADICAYYKGRCAHCGKSVKNPDKGHIDPRRCLQSSIAQTTLDSGQV